MSKKNQNSKSNNRTQKSNNSSQANNNKNNSNNNLAHECNRDNCTSCKNNQVNEL